MKYLENYEQKLLNQGDKYYSIANMFKGLKEIGSTVFKDSTFFIDSNMKVILEYDSNKNILFMEKNTWRKIFPRWNDLMGTDSEMIEKRIIFVVKAMYNINANKVFHESIHTTEHKWRFIEHFLRK